MAVKKRTSKTITNKEDIDFLINLTENDIDSYSLINELFGTFNGKNRFNPYDIITIPAGYYGKEKKKNTKPFTTTVGQWIFNKYVIEPDFIDLFNYVNTPVSNKVFGNMNKKISYAVLEDRATVDQLKSFISKTQQFLPHIAILSPSYSENMLLISKKINVRKKELLKKYKKDIDEKNIIVVTQIQNELLDYARELMKDDPAMDAFDSGAGGSFDNNFKNTFIMRGAVRNPDPSKGYDIITSNFIDGISKEEYSMIANSLSAGPYKRAKKTEGGGYNEKLVFNACQHLKMDPQGSDCGTKRFIEVDVTNDIIDDIMYSYMIVGSRLVRIEESNSQSLIGKTIKMRYSSLCESKSGGFCNKCTGDLPYLLNELNIGMAMPQLMSRLKVIQMKGFHDAQIRLVEMDPMKAFSVKS